MSWYYVVGSEQKGPVSDTDLDALYRKGIINSETLIWSAGMEKWTSYSIARSQLPAGSVPSTAVNLVTCAISGKQVPADAAIPIEGTWVSAEYKEQAIQRIREGLPLGSTLRYAGFWIRFAAVFIDGIVLNIASTLVFVIFGIFVGIVGAAGKQSESLQVVTGILGLLMLLAVVILAAAYEIVFIVKNGATLGKMACGLKVISADGKPIGYGTSIGRYFAKALSYMILLIGYIMAAFDDEKRALHDRLCETRVVYK